MDRLEEGDSCLFNCRERIDSPSRVQARLHRNDAQVFRDFSQWPHEIRKGRESICSPAFTDENSLISSSLVATHRDAKAKQASTEKKHCGRFGNRRSLYAQLELSGGAAVFIR